MKLIDFEKKIHFLENQCLHFEMTEKDYDDLFSYMLSRKRIRHLKKHFYDQLMSYFDLVGIEVNYINPQMAEITKIINTEIRNLQVKDIIVRVNEQTDFFNRMQFKGKTITISALRNLYSGSIHLIEENVEFKGMRFMDDKISIKVFSKQKIGLIRLIDFNFDIELFAKALMNLKQAKVTTVLFDLRSNLGGSVKRANRALDMLLPKDSIKYYYIDKHNNSKIERVASEDWFIFDKIIILLNRFSLSSSEIFTIALREQIGATVAGERSGGKGAIIIPLKIEEDSYVMLPKYEYFSPNGNKVEGVGVEPDITLEELGTILDAEICSTLGIETVL